MAIEEKFYNNPIRLLSALRIAPSRSSGYVCPNCNSGTGPRGTGMEGFRTQAGKWRYKCFACDKCFSPIDLVKNMVQTASFLRMIEYLEALYAPDVDLQNDRELPIAKRSYSSQQLPSLVIDERLQSTYERSIAYRKSCPQWQQKAANILCLPFEALNRPDIGKSFIGDDGDNPDCGDLVTYNLYNGSPIALKVRHSPGLGYPQQLTMLDYKTNSFVKATIRDSERTFRQAGMSGKLCFGHDSITDNTSSVVVVEGQSDVLAVCAAAREVNISDITAIGRDSASHLLQEADLSAMRGKRVIYCQDADSAGSSLTDKNLSLISQFADSTYLWAPHTPGCKDVRATYCNLGAADFMNDLNSTSILYA